MNPCVIYCILLLKFNFISKIKKDYFQMDLNIDKNNKLNNDKCETYFYR